MDLVRTSGKGVRMALVCFPKTICSVVRLSTSCCRSCLLFFVFSDTTLFAQDGPTTVPPEARQLIVAVAKNWESSRASLRCFERSKSGQWRPVLFGEPIPVLLGRGGLAWGRGVLPAPARLAAKREGDKKAPAGCFALGKVFGYAKSLPEGARYPYRRVTRWDAWVDDVRNPHYNRHYVADPKNVPKWFEKQRMRLGDAAYTWMIEIRHNADPPVPGAGSAIFFHVRRGPDRKTSGCTTMRRSDLEKIIRWLRVEARPHYVLLPADLHTQLRRPWKLP